MMEIVQIEKKDIKNLVKLILDTGNLDCNSSYLYLLLAHYFSKNCLIAKVGDEIVGFVTSLNIKEDALFIWQIGVAKNFQKRGIAIKLLEDLLKNQTNKVSYIEFTISPSNKSSMALFEKYAQKIGSQIKNIGEFSQNLFFEKNHEEEIIYQIKL